MSSFPLRRMLTGLKARYHLWSGRRAYRMGAYSDAGAHFHKAIEDGYESFEAHLSLGKIYLRKQDFRRAAMFFHRSRTIDPGRFLLEGFPDDFIESLQAELPPTRRHEYRIVISSAGEPGGRPARRPPTLQPLGDFRSRDELLEHRDRPALRPGEWADVDWDAEARRLFGGD